MAFEFESVSKPKSILKKDWNDWKWQMRHMTEGFRDKKSPFLQGATPYYQRLCVQKPDLSAIIHPSLNEESLGLQALKDPLGEEDHSPFPRLIHRYPDRVLFLVTDTCSVYCRYCTRKRFTGKKHSLPLKKEREEIFSYIEKGKGIREVILSGGDALSLSDLFLESLLKRLREIPHIEIIRVASRMPAACPMRLTPSLIKILKRYQPLFLMTHFNHPFEITKEVSQALTRVADHGILMFNQMVLLKGINNHPSLIQALSRRLLYLRVKPYYMFQCDPSLGTDHFRTSLEDSLKLQKELSGKLSGLAMPTLSMDIPGGGGKVSFSPHFLKEKSEKEWSFEGFDGKKGVYKNPGDTQFKKKDLKDSPFLKEWELLKNQTYGKN